MSEPIKQLLATAEGRSSLRKLADGECFYCAKGFPLKDGIHCPTQALGMIPNTACEKLSGLVARRESVATEPLDATNWRATALVLLDALEAAPQHTAALREALRNLDELWLIDNLDALSDDEIAGIKRELGRHREVRLTEEATHRMLVELEGDRAFIAVCRARFAS